VKDEHIELLRFFFRKWSTIELTDDARMLLREDVMHIQVMLEIDDVDTSILQGAEDALDRHWFAKKYQKL
jgi:hypothetical protein